MRRASVLSVTSLVLLLSFSEAVSADPILYSISGQIRLGTSDYEDFAGTFLLSDPVVSLYDLSDSRGDQLDRYTVTDLSLSSASYSVSGNGFMGVWWELYRGFGVAVNSIDSSITLFTSIGLIETDIGNFPDWIGDPGAQPLGFSGLTEGIGFPRVGGIRDVRAERVTTVPEPSTLLLWAAGLSGLALAWRTRASVTSTPGE